MSETRLTKEEAKSCYDAVDEVMKAFPKSKVGSFLGHFNDVLLFLGEAKSKLPSKKEGENPSNSFKEDLKIINDGMCCECKMLGQYLKDGKWYCKECALDFLDGVMLEDIGFKRMGDFK